MVLVDRVNLTNYMEVMSMKTNLDELKNVMGLEWEMAFQKKLAEIAKDKKKNKIKRMEEWQNLSDLEEFGYDNSWK